MNLADITRQRLANQHLVLQRFGKPSDVVAKLGAIQAQDYAGAKWAVAQRSRGAVDATVEQALIDGSIIRTHVLRPTWHFVAPADIRWLLALTAPRVKAAIAFQTRWLGLDKAAFRGSGRALTRALRGGKALTRAELSQVLAQAGLPVAGEQRMGNFLMHAELEGIVCSGARRGKQFTYVLLDERVPATVPVERDEALLRLTNIYFATRGPATPADFAWWSGLTVADAKKGIDLAGPTLERATVEGRTYWYGAGAPIEVRSSHTARLLSNFDEYAVAYRDRSALAQRLKKSGVEVRNDKSLANIVVIAGQLVGTWKRTFYNNAAIVEVNLLTDVSRTERKAIATAAEEYGDFLGLPVELRLASGPVSVSASTMRRREQTRDESAIRARKTTECPPERIE